MTPQTTNIWTDMIDLVYIQNNSRITTFKEWDQQYAFVPKKPCSGTLGPIHVADEPKIPLSLGSETRTLEFDVVFYSTPNCGCKSEFKRFRATQFLMLEGGSPDWGGSYFTDPIIE